MTPRQQEIYDFIVSYRMDHGYSPTLQEIATEQGVTKTTIHEQTQEMIRKGTLMQDGQRKRSIRPTDGKAKQAAKMIQNVADRLHALPNFQAELRRAATMLLSA